MVHVQCSQRFEVPVNLCLLQFINTISIDEDFSEELLSPTSPRHSLSSGNLADVSSLSSGSRLGGSKGDSIFSSPSLPAVSSGSSRSGGSMSRHPSGSSSKSPASLTCDVPTAVQTISEPSLVPLAGETGTAEQPAEEKGSRQAAADNTVPLFSMESVGPPQHSIPHADRQTPGEQKTSDSSVLQQSESLFTSTRTDSKSTSGRRSSSSIKPWQERRQSSDSEMSVIPETEPVVIPPRGVDQQERSTLATERQESESQFLIPDTAPRQGRAKFRKGGEVVTAPPSAPGHIEGKDLIEQEQEQEQHIDPSRWCLKFKRLDSDSYSGTSLLWQPHSHRLHQATCGVAPWAWHACVMSATIPEKKEVRMLSKCLVEFLALSFPTVVFGFHSSLLHCDIWRLEDTSF